MEINGNLEVVRVAIATSALLDSSDLGIESFRNSVGDAMLKISQHIGQMPCNQFGRLDHGCELSMNRPVITYKSA